jgi:hypothetical protein
LTLIAMTTKTEHPLQMPNQALQDLAVLVGEWATTGTHPMLPDTTLHGHASFTWLEGGAFLRLRSSVNDPRFPTGVTVIGRDEAAEGYSMLYFDERGVARIFQMAFTGRVWAYWRNSPAFSQRVTATLAVDGQTIVSIGEMSKDGAPWEGDLSLTYTRVR